MAPVNLISLFMVSCLCASMITSSSSTRKVTTLYSEAAALNLLGISQVNSAERSIVTSPKTDGIGSSHTTALITPAIKWARRLSVFMMRVTGSLYLTKPVLYLTHVHPALVYSHCLTVCGYVAGLAISLSLLLRRHRDGCPPLSTTSASLSGPPE